ncbi:MAG: hypothetical protein KAR14_10070, partial [Candidatus Aminicenantes bacterium]|nr:hypothetical protein [Candidatus Aminicenantes bacterium]
MYLKKNSFKMILILFISLNFIFSSGFAEEINSNLPVKDPQSDGATLLKGAGVTNLFSIDMLLDSVKDGNSIGLLFDLSGINKTLGNREIDISKIYGDIYAGPYPFEKDETEYAYKRF